jgi:hypothetical protein
MAYYRYRPDSNNFSGVGFQWAIDSPEERQVLDVHETDVSLAEAWVPPIAHGFGDNPLAHGDFPSLSNYWRIPVMSRRAWDVLCPLIGYCCEALPIVHPSGDAFCIVHVMATIDALDEEKSKLRRSQVDGRVNRVFEYAFRSERLAGKHIFKLPLNSGGELLVDEEFRRIVEANGLQGLLFDPLSSVQ